MIISLGTILYNVFFGLFVFAYMIFVHEIGHAFSLNKYTKQKVKIQWGFKEISVGTQKQINSLNNIQYSFVLSSGILAGFIPLLLTSGLFSVATLYIIFISYLIVCKSDFISMFNSIKERKKRKKIS